MVVAKYQFFFFFCTLAVVDFLRSVGLEITVFGRELAATPQLSLTKCVTIAAIITIVSYLACLQSLRPFVSAHALGPPPSPP